MRLAYAVVRNALRQRSATEPLPKNNNTYSLLLCDKYGEYERSSSVMMRSHDIVVLVVNFIGPDKPTPTLYFTIPVGPSGSQSVCRSACQSTIRWLYGWLELHTRDRLSKQQIMN